MSENPFECAAERYDAWYDEHPLTFRAELEAIHAVLPPRQGTWIEIGVGTGRFAQALEIPIGIEPACAMGKFAASRGIDVREGRAEALPLASGTVDTAFLLTTLCFLDDPAVAFNEIARVLLPAGHLILGFVPADSPLGEVIQETAASDPFFAHATLLSRSEVTRLLKSTGFRIRQASHTLCGLPSAFEQASHRPNTGWSDGSFAVLRASASR